MIIQVIATVNASDLEKVKELMIQHGNQCEEAWDLDDGEVALPINVDVQGNKDAEDEVQSILENAGLPVYVEYVEIPEL